MGLPNGLLMKRSGRGNRKGDYLRNKQVSSSQIRGFDAVFADFGPGFPEDCIEAIS